MTSRFDAGVALGLLLCFSAFTIQSHALGGGSLVSAVLLLGSILGLLAAGYWSDLKFDLCDVVFGLLIASILASVANTGLSDPKEGLLLAITLCSYPAARAAGRHLLTMGFFAVLIPVIVLGSIETLWALIAQWDQPHGKPVVLTVDAGATIFAVVTGYAVLALAASALPLRQTALAGALLCLPVAIWAASMVRLTLALIPISLACMATFGGKNVRTRALALAVLVMLATGSGLASRPAMTSIYARYALAAVVQSPSRLDCAATDLDNSIVIRLVLYREALRLFGESGWLGIGFNQIPDRACPREMEVHNSIVQAIVELGPLSGILLIVLIVLPLRSLRVLAPISRDAAFALGAVIFITLLSLAHGRLSRDIQLFALLGYAASIRSHTFEIAKTWMLRQVPA
jgi:hypothetical protein